MSKEWTESEVRKLRANVYGECTDHNWEHCKENWMQPSEIEWLLTQQPKEKKP